MMALVKLFAFSGAIDSMLAAADLGEQHDFLAVAAGCFQLVL